MVFDTLIAIWFLGGAASVVVGGGGAPRAPESPVF
jgi:hypothetical protein